MHAVAILASGSALAAAMETAVTTQQSVDPRVSASPCGTWRDTHPSQHYGKESSIHRGRY